MKSLIATAFIGFLIAISPQASAQTPLTESQAVLHAQNTIATQLDPSLPNRPFGRWFDQVVGDEAGVTWQLRDCGDQKETGATGNRDIPACVEITAMFPNERMIVVMATVGTFNKGIIGKPRIQFIVVEEYGHLKELKRLSGLPAVLQQPPSKPPRRVGVQLPIAQAGRLPTFLYQASTWSDVTSVGGDEATRNLGRISDRDGEPPPPLQPAPEKSRIPQTLQPATVITKVQPIYPAVARQINASGEVNVRVSIGEDGRVTEAVAISGHPLLQSAAEGAARRWIFKPAILNGKPVRSQSTLTFLFVRPE